MRLTVALLLSLILLAACGGNDDDQAPATASSPASGDSTPTLSSDVPVPTNHLLDVVRPLPLASALTEPSGRYMMDMEEGDIWPNVNAASRRGGYFIRAECCNQDMEPGLDIIDAQTGERTRVLRDMVYSSSPSPDGSLIAFNLFTNGQPQPAIYLIEPDGTGLRGPISEDAIRAGWSPDGQFLSLFSGNDLSVYSLAHGDVTQVAHTTTFPPTYEWSPAEPSLAYWSEGTVYAYDATTRQSRALIEADQPPQMTWSPDGTRIIMPHSGDASSATGSGLGSYQIIDARGEAEPIALPPSRFLSWAPSSERITYISEGCETDDWDIYTVRADGTDVRRITNAAPEYKEGTAWSADSTRILYSSSGALLLVEIETGGVTVVATHQPPGNTSSLHYHGAVDDSRFALFWVGGGHGICD